MGLAAFIKPEKSCLKGTFGGHPAQIHYGDLTAMVCLV